VLVAVLQNSERFRSEGPERPLKRNQMCVVGRGDIKKNGCPERQSRSLKKKKYRPTSRRIDGDLGDLA